MTSPPYDNKPATTREPQERPRVCLFYNDSGCNHSDHECWFVHMCEPFLRGSCGNGDLCARSHSLVGTKWSHLDTEEVGLVNGSPLSTFPSPPDQPDLKQPVGAFPPTPLNYGGYGAYSASVPVCEPSDSSLETWTPQEQHKARCSKCLNWKKNSEKNFDPDNHAMVCKLCWVFMRSKQANPGCDDKQLRAKIKEDRRAAKEAWIGAHSQAQGYAGFVWGNASSDEIQGGETHISMVFEGGAEDGQNDGALYGHPIENFHPVQYGVQNESHVSRFMPNVQAALFVPCSAHGMSA